MMSRLETRIGRLRLKNPVIAAAGEHLIDAAGIRSAILAGAGAVVGKSTNESDAARDQLTRAEYVALGPDWRPVNWGADAPAATVLTRSGLHPLGFDEWLAQSVDMDRFAREHNCLYVPSLILAAPEPAVAMARAIEAAGFQVLEFNIGTPYASQAAKGAVATELSPERVGELTAMMVRAVDIPVWIKITGQSERVPDLAAAAFAAGAESVVMAGRSLGLVPDLDTMAPLLGTSCGVGGFWNLPLTCHWLAATRASLGPEPSLIGINGATSGEDVARMLLAGASAAGLSSAVMLRGWQVLSDAVATLDSYCAARGLAVPDIIGRAADARKRFADMPRLNAHWRNFIPAPLGRCHDGAFPMTDQNARIDALLQGAVDLHTHPGPSLHPRKVDHIEVVREADAAGMRAVLIKDHYYPTMPITRLINDNLGFRTRAIGAIVLNNPVGGLNPSAVDYALKQGARVVWMATAHARNHLEHEAKEAGFTNKFPVNSKKTVPPVPTVLVDGKGAVLDEVKQILDLVAEADAVVSAGHHHISECYPFYEEARARGVKRLFLNHPTYVNEGTLEDIRQLVAMGVKIEHSICMFVPSTFHLFDDAHLRDCIAAAGVEHTLLGSDLGQKNNPTPVEGFRQIIEVLIRLGYSDGEIRLMTATNAAELVGLDA